jgi:hypothetical protein
LACTLGLVRPLGPMGPGGDSYRRPVVPGPDSEPLTP